MNKFDSVETALEVLSKGGLILVSDDECRENEGDLMGIAELITPQSINFMITHGKGIVCFSIVESIAKRLNLPQMVENNTEKMRTAFTVSIDAHPRFGVTTGVSAYDRAKTIQVALDNNTKPEDLLRPGHVFPLVSREGGVLTRNGHTEASTDLARLAGFKPSGVIIETILANGRMARQKDLFEFKELYRLPYITIEALKEYRLKYDIQEIKAI
ncbi:MAG: 3,4-dihydroxy-2-butanone-4-phosphate synthase [Bacillales bacterium]|nr:3,4-dihydroxy-2-butanone-4-phosphate synthase [Bacillales bacterium]